MKRTLSNIAASIGILAVLGSFILIHLGEYGLAGLVATGGVALFALAFLD